MIESEGPGNPDASSFESERERLRAVLDFPESVESSDSFERHVGRRGHEEPTVAKPVESDAGPIAVDDSIGRQLEQLSVRVSALAGLVESVFDRVGHSVGSSPPLTAEELADISARMVRVIEVRLETHSERLEQVIAALATREPQPDAGGEGDGANLGLIDDHMAMIGRAIMDVKEAIKELEQPPSKMQEMAILAHFDRWFEETNSRQATEVEHVRRDMHRFDQALTDMRATLTELPGRVATVQPIARLDASILQQLEARLAETSEGLAQKAEDQLAAQVQRFEALSQSMMTTVGDPVDPLADKFSQLVRAQEAAANALQSIGGLTQIQSRLVAAISSLRQDGVEREALLRQALEKLDRLTEPG